MKIRTDFVTNSSSSSFICCFARIADPEKAKSVLEEHKNKIEVYTGEEVVKAMHRSRWSEWLEYDWAGINLTPSEAYVVEHIEDSFILITEYDDIYPDEDGEVDYDVDHSDFSDAVNAAIDAITAENGFAEIICDYGAGYNG